MRHIRGMLCLTCPPAFVALVTGRGIKMASKLDTEGEGRLVVRQDRKVKMDDTAQKQFTIKVGIDFTGLSKYELAKIAFRALWIDVQRRLRETSEKYLSELEVKGLTIHATECSKKIQTDEQKRDAMIKNIMVMTGCDFETAKKKLIAMLKAE